MVTCQICQKEIKDFQRLSSHIKIHKISSIEYYKKYIGTGKCTICGTENVRFMGLKVGFRKFCKKCCRGLTLEKCIIRHGEKEGTKIWEEYCKKQAYTNGFEYKSKKYKMTKEEFIEYNKNRSVTLNNMVKRHGEKEGTKKWEEYCDKQRTNGNSKEYFIDKYGEKEGTKKWIKVNKSKVNSLENFQKRYGKEKGTQIFEKYMSEKKIKSFSKISQKLFWEIYNHVKSENIYFYELNKEFGKLNKLNGEYYYYDFVDLNNKKIIEFNGNCFHVKNINESSKWKNPFSNIGAEDTYQKDLRKKEFVEKLGFQVLYIWEDEYRKNDEKELKKCLNFLGV